MSRTEFRAQVAREMSEAALQTRVLGLARELGWELGYHTHDSRRSQPGFPDLVLLSTTRLRLVMAELKTERGRVSLAQQAWLTGLAAAGIERHVWRPTDLLDGRILAVLTGEEVDHA